MMSIGKIRQLLGIKPPFVEARQKIQDAIAAVQVSESNTLKEAIHLIDKIMGGDKWLDGPDWVELEMWAEEFHMNVTDVHDLIHLLEAIDESYGQ
jgi:hypothetical protein